MRKLTCIALALTATLSTLPVGSTLAQDILNEPTASLKGTFHFTVAKTCIDSVLGSSLHVYYDGTLTYNGSGAAHLAQRGTLILPGLPTSSFEETAELTYTVKPNGGVSQEGTFRAVDQSYTLTGAKMTGHMDPHGSVLIFSSAIPPERETMTLSGGGVTEYLCGTSGMAVRTR